MRSVRLASSKCIGRTSIENRQGQDLYVIPRSTVREFSSLGYRGGLLGELDGARVRSGRIGFSGWAADLTGRCPVTDLRIVANEVERTPSLQTVQRTDIEPICGGPEYRRSGWSLDLPLEAIGPEDWVRIKISADGQSDTIVIDTLAEMQGY